MLLPYYDCVRYAIIDPMHNLFLGTAKRILQKQWLQNDLIRREDINTIQQRMNSFYIPGSTGKIQHKVLSQFSNLNANEWKNWTLIFSLLSLYDILPEEHFACWHHFVSACAIYCSTTISTANIDKGHELMQKKFESAETLYGPSFLSLNTHLHLHLNQCFKDFGPCYGYWLFSFERYNGLLGQYLTNQRAIEIQLMQRFINDMHIKSIANSHNANLTAEQKKLFNDFFQTKSTTEFTETVYGQGHSFSCNNSNSNISALLSLSSSDLSHSLLYVDNSSIKLLPPYKVHKFDDDSLRYLKASYQVFLPDVEAIDLPELCCKHHTAEWWGMRLVKHEYQESKLLYFQAYWIGRDGNISDDCTSLNAGLIEFFFSQRLEIRNQHEEVIMAKVQWLQDSPEKNALKELIQLWNNNLFKPFGPASFIPLLRIHEVCVGCEIEFKGEQLLAISPLRKKVFL